jgi:hypothetical protein
LEAALAAVDLKLGAPLAFYLLTVAREGGWQLMPQDAVMFVGGGITGIIAGVVLV